MSEADTAFRDIEAGMSAIGTAVVFTCDGAAYTGTVSVTDLATQMLTGGYQGRSEITIRATKGQFPIQPNQRGQVVITMPADFAGPWERKEVTVNVPVHYVFTLIKQVQP